jgi:hypothetical protein
MIANAEKIVDTLDTIIRDRMGENYQLSRKEKKQLMDLLMGPDKRQVYIWRKSPSEHAILSFQKAPEWFTAREIPIMRAMVWAEQAEPGQYMENQDVLIIRLKDEA